MQGQAAVGQAGVGSTRKQQPGSSYLKQFPDLVMVLPEQYQTRLSVDGKFGLIVPQYCAVTEAQYTEDIPVHGLAGLASGALANSPSTAAISARLAALGEHKLLNLIILVSP